MSEGGFGCGGWALPRVTGVNIGVQHSIIMYNTASLDGVTGTNVGQRSIMLHALSLENPGSDIEGVKVIINHM